MQWFSLVTARARLNLTSADSRIHYSDVIMGAMASQITSLTIVYSTVYSGADQRKHQNSPHKGPVTRKMFLFDDGIVIRVNWVYTIAADVLTLCVDRWSLFMPCSINISRCFHAIPTTSTCTISVWGNDRNHTYIILYFVYIFPRTTQRAKWSMQYCNISADVCLDMMDYPGGFQWR